MRRKPPRASAEREARLADQTLLVRRLIQLGLSGVHSVSVHENRTVMASVTQKGVLRVHRGYAYASDRVLRAIVQFTDPRCGPSDRDAARRTISEFSVEAFVGAAPRRRCREPPAPGDGGLLRALRGLHDELNHEFFGDVLSPIQFRLSGRMTRRLGEITVEARKGAPLEIAISRRHIERDGWDEVRQTILHEMVHQWQVESGSVADHGAMFRQKALEIGIAPSAERAVGDVIRV